MSIEARVLKSSNELEFEAELSEFLSTGWEVVSSHVVGTIEHTYCAILKRVPVTERMDLAALNEITRQNQKAIRKLISRLQVIESTLDDDTQADDTAPYDLARVYGPVNFVPLESITVLSVIEEALKEDELLERASNHVHQS